MEKDIKGLKNDVKDLKNDVVRIEIKLEHDIEPKIQALFDDGDIVHSKLDLLNRKLMS